MKKLLLLPAFVLGLCFCATAQKYEGSGIPAIPLTYQDTLLVAYNMIDNLALLDLQRVEEIYVRKCMMDPSELNRTLLAYIKKRKLIFE